MSTRADEVAEGAAAEAGPTTAFLVRHDPGRERYIEERCHVNEWCNTADDPAVSIAHARVPPGVTTRWHRLRGTVERYVVLAGEGVVDVGVEAPARVGPGDVVVIPAGVRQRVRCTSAQDLCFLAVCSPRFRWEAYEDVDGEEDAAQNRLPDRAADSRE